MGFIFYTHFDLCELASTSAYAVARDMKTSPILFLRSNSTSAMAMISTTNLDTFGQTF